MKVLRAGCCAILLAIVGHSPAFTAGRSCEDLASLALPATTISLAQPVAAGAFETIKNLPAFCCVAATLTPTTDSDIKGEVWMPASGWDGKILAVGNGGWGGALTVLPVWEAARRGVSTHAP